MKTKQLREKYGCVHTNLPISQLHNILHNHTWQTNVMAWYFEEINIYASNQICTLMNINEDIKNETKK